MADLFEPTEKPLVMVVEDNAVNMRMLNELLMPYYRVRLATNAEQAQKGALQDPKPDAILLDIVMPRMDGYQLCSWLKNDPATAEIPVIFLTAKTQIEDAQRGFDLGCADYITKPIMPPVVLARVKTHIALKRAREFMKGKSWI
ncbi:MAG: response regulator [Burkholderiales bacterium]